MTTMSIKKVKKLYEENRQMVDATVKSDQKAFAEYLVANHQELCEELDKAKKAGKNPLGLILKTQKIYLRWKNSGGK